MLNQMDLERVKKTSVDKRLAVKYNGKSPLDYNNLDSQNPRRRGLRASAKTPDPTPPKGLRGAPAPTDIFNNEFDFGYSTPLQVAVALQQIEEVKRLFAELEAASDEARAQGREVDYDIWEPNSYGWTPLHMAVRTGNLEMVRLLVEEFGADINAKSNWGGTPLFWSKRSLSPIHKVTKYLINIDAIDEQTL